MSFSLTISISCRLAVRIPDGRRLGHDSTQWSALVNFSSQPSLDDDDDASDDDERCQLNISGKLH